MASSFKLCIIVALVSTAAHAEDDVPLAKGTPAPFTGVLMSTEEYAKSIKDKADQDKLKLKTMSLEELVKFKDSKYQELLDLKQKEIEMWREQAKRTWWEQNQLQVGVVIGIAATIGVTFAVAQAVK